MSYLVTSQSGSCVSSCNTALHFKTQTDACTAHVFADAVRDVLREAGFPNAEIETILREVAACQVPAGFETVPGESRVTCLRHAAHQLTRTVYVAGELIHAVLILAASPLRIAAKSPVLLPGSGRGLVVELLSFLTSGIAPSFAQKNAGERSSPCSPKPENTLLTVTPEAFFAAARLASGFMFACENRRLSFQTALDLCVMPPHALLSTVFAVKSASRGAAARISLYLPLNHPRESSRLPPPLPSVAAPRATGASGLARLITHKGPRVKHKRTCCLSRHNTHFALLASTPVCTGPALLRVAGIDRRTETINALKLSEAWVRAKCALDGPALTEKLAAATLNTPAQFITQSRPQSRLLEMPLKEDGNSLFLWTGTLPDWTAADIAQSLRRIDNEIAADQECRGFYLAGKTEDGFTGFTFFPLRAVFIPEAFLESRPSLWINEARALGLARWDASERALQADTGATARTDAKGVVHPGVVLAAFDRHLMQTLEAIDTHCAKSLQAPLRLLLTTSVEERLTAICEETQTFRNQVQSSAFAGKLPDVATVRAFTESLETLAGPGAVKAVQSLAMGELAQCVLSSVGLSHEAQIIKNFTSHFSAELARMKGRTFRKFPARIKRLSL